MRMESEETLTATKDVEEAKDEEKDEESAAEDVFNVYPEIETQKIFFSSFVEE